MDDQTIAYQDVHEFAKHIEGQDDKAKLQSFIEFRLKNFSDMTAEAVIQLDEWINALRFSTTCKNKLRRTC